MKKVLKALLILIVIVFVFFAVILILALNDSDKEPVSETASGDKSTEAPAKETPKAEEPIWETDGITVYYKGAEDKEYVPGEYAMYASFRIENNTDRKITVYLDDASFDDIMIPMVMSGLPVEALPGKKVNGAFIVTYYSVSLENMDDIETFNFSIEIMDADTYSTIAKSSPITVHLHE